MIFDESQLEAIKSLENTLVIAGAGSGKTATIVGKINYLIENNFYKANEILVISFTNETVNSLKERVNHSVDIKTFHKLGLDIIKEYEKKDITIASDYELRYVINEYFNSFALYNRKTNIFYKRLLQNSNEEEIKKLIETFIKIYKSNYTDIYALYDFYKKSFFIDKIYFKMILDIYTIYSRELKSSGKKDFNDFIIDATKIINDNKIDLSYKFIIIDEFQDSSYIRFKLIDSIIKQTKAKLFVVGDDYQSIYRFSGCDISLFLNLKKYIDDLSILYLNYNYRNGQTLINVANNFIIKNKSQMVKRTICIKDKKKPIKVIPYNKKDNIVSKLINSINGNILILGRNNRDKDLFNIKEDARIKFLTIHRAKGLEEDNVILVNLTNHYLGFPSKIKKEKIISKVLKTDYIQYEEERRLFYVALTRTKNNIYLVVPRDNRSIFVSELIKYNYKDIEFIDIHNK